MDDSLKITSFLTTLQSPINYILEFPSEDMRLKNQAITSKVYLDSDDEEILFSREGHGLRAFSDRDGKVAIPSTWTCATRISRSIQILTDNFT